MQDAYLLLIRKLRSFTKKYYQNLLIRGSLIFTAFLLVSTIVFAIMEHYGNFSVAVRTFLFWVLLLSLGVAFVLLIITPLIKLTRLTKNLSQEGAAKIIGEHFPEVQDRLTNVLQLKKQTDVNTALLEASIRQKSEALSPIPFSSAVNFFENKRYLKYLLAPTAFVLIVFAFGKEEMLTDSTVRIIDHQTEYTPKPPFAVSILNKDLTVVQQEDYLLQVKIDGKQLPVDVFLLHKGLSIKMKKRPKHIFEYEFKNLQKTESFTLKAGGFSFKEHQLRVLPKPSLLRFELSLDYPNYTGKADEMLNNIGEVQVPKGTQAKWSVFVENTDSLVVFWGGGSIEAEKENSNQFVFSKKAEESTSYTLIPENEHVSSKDSMTYQFAVINDAYPVVDVKDVSDSTFSKKRYFEGFIYDDYGFNKLYFVANNPENNWDSIVPIPVNKDLKQDHFLFVFDMQNMPISKGERLEYFFEVYDNDGINGSKKTRSRVFELKVPTEQDIKDFQAEQTTGIKKKINENVILAKDLQKEFEDLQMKLLDKDNLTWEDKKHVRELLQKQKALEENIDQISENFRQKNETINDFTEQDQRILDKQKELEELMDKLMTDEMRELFDEMDQLMDDLGNQKWMDMIEELQMSNEDLEKELDRNLELLKQFEFEEALQESINDIQEFKSQQEELKETSDDEKVLDEDLAAEQRELNEQFEELSKKLEDLLQKNQELDRPEPLFDSLEIKEGVQQLLDESLENLEKGKRKKASQAQQKTIEELETVLNMLKEAQSPLEDQAPPEDMEALRQILENLIDLSLDEESLLLELSEINKNDPTYVSMIHWQSKLDDDSKILEDSLYALSRRQAQIEATVNREMNSINNNIQKSLEHMAERETKKALGRQQLVMTSANNLAVMLSDVLQSMQEQTGEGMPGQQHCNKPGSSSPTPGDLKRMQQELKDQLEQMKNGQKPNKGEGVKSNKGLVQMMRRQEMIRMQLQKLADKIEGDDKQAKDRLNHAIEKMEQTEEDIANENITKQTLDRQNQIIQHLLEVEKADQERGEDKKRESKESNQIPHSAEDVLEEYKRQKIKQAELLKSIPPNLKPFYKEKVNQYFQRREQR